jgi:hypothetical protein
MKLRKIKCSHYWLRNRPKYYLIKLPSWMAGSSCLVGMSPEFRQFYEKYYADESNTNSKTFWADYKEFLKIPNEHAKETL